MFLLKKVHPTAIKFRLNCVCVAADLLEKVGELVEKLFDTDEELMKSWITAPPREEDSAESHLDVALCLLEASKQLRSDHGEHFPQIRIQYSRNV